MQAGVDGDNSVGARKALAKVQKMLQLVSAKRHALALRDYRETLDECLKAEASATMKILAYRMAQRVPTCTAHEIWQLLLDACVTELASSQNAPVLLYSIPLLEQIPLPLVVGFLVSSDKEPMNKLRAVLQHEQSDVRCCAIAALSKITLDAAVAIANDGLFAFPFDSHESRIVCQQDLWTIITDVWKVIFQSLGLDDTAREDDDVAGAAFAALRLLFAKTAAMAPFHGLNATAAAPHHTAAYSAANDLAASMYKGAFPRIRRLTQCAKQLPMKYQVDAAWWLAMLLSMMMDRSGAKCPGLSVAYLNIDVVHDDDNDDDEARASTERMRVDQLAAGVLESWLVPLLGKKIPLAQSVALCRAVYILLSHPLQTFSRMKHASTLVQQLTAQCYFHKSTDLKLEMSHLVVRAFAWVSSSDCLVWFPRVVEAIHLLERETDRRDLLQLLMDSLCSRVLVSRDFLLLESIAALDIFRQPSGASRLSPRTSGSNVYRALVQALLAQDPDEQTLMERQVAQLIVLKAFIQVILYKTNASMFARPLHDDETHDVMCYVSLVSNHFQNMLRQPTLALRESLQFYQHDLQRAWKQITSCAVRLQLLRIGIELHERHQLVSVPKLIELLMFEVSQSYSSRDNEQEHLSDALGGSSSAMFDDGKLGGGSIHGAIYDSDADSNQRDEHNVAVVAAISDILKALSCAGEQYRSELQQLQTTIRSYFTTHVPSSSLQSLILDEPLTTVLSAIKTVYAFEIFQPASVFQPPRQTPQAPLPPTEEPRPPVLITGSIDPLTLHVSYQQVMAGHEDVLTLCVSCCNTSNLPLSDFEIHIRPRGPVRCIDPSNDLKIRVQQGGSSTSTNLPPFGMLKAEKRFLVQRFAQAVFYFQVVYYEASGSDEPIAIRVAPASPYIVNFDAFFRRSADTFLTPAFFQQTWQAAEEGMAFDVESTHDATRSLSRAQTLLKALGDRVAVVAGLLVDLPGHTQICFLTKTRWDDYVVCSLTLLATNGSNWTGLCELRSSSQTISELAKHPQDVLTIFCGSVACVVSTSVAKTAIDGVANRTASRTTSRTVSAKTPAAHPPPSVVDPFDGNSVDPFGGSHDLTFASAASPVDAKWDNSTFGGFGGLSGEQVRPTEPTTFAAFGGGTTAPTTDPWGF